MKISNSLGIISFNLSDIFHDSLSLNNLIIKEEIRNSLQNNLFIKWKRYLSNNIRDVELSDISITYNQTSGENTITNLTNETIFDKGSVLVINYLLRLDPRLSQNSQTIDRVIHAVNEKLFDKNNNIYQDIMDFGDLFSRIKAIKLFSSQSSCNFWKHVYFCDF